MELATQDIGDIGDFSHPEEAVVDDDILRYLLSDSPSSEGSSPDSTPPSTFDDTTDDSPMHWSQHEMLTPPVVPQLSELSLDLNSELLLYGSNLNTADFTFDSSPTTPPTEVPVHVQPQVIQPNLPIVPIVQPPIQPLPIVQPPTQTQVRLPIVEPPLLRKNRASSKKRPRSDAPDVPSPAEHVALPRDTLLQITSQSMERYVETLQTTRQLSTDDQKELKRQKRLIKNRESAQLSRERKRAYIDQLEARIAELTSENNQLKTDNSSLRQTLARYLPDGIKTEPGKDSVQQTIATKMGGLLTVGGNNRATATKAGVCLLIVLFSFGLFMNANKPSTSVVSRFPGVPSGALPEVRFDRGYFGSRALAPATEVVGVKRSLLEAFPEVKEEENDTDFMYESAKAFPKALPDKPPTPSSDKNDAARHVIRLTADSDRVHTRSTVSVNGKQGRALQKKIDISQAGIFKVSYSPEPANFVEGEHSHDDSNNSTYMLFLDPRPDLDESDVENASSPVSATHDTHLQVATPRVAKKDDASFPPMIISLVIPDHIANGSNPLLLPEGLNPAESLMEITCQVIDISITTSERPRN